MSTPTPAEKAKRVLDAHPCLHRVALSATGTEDLSRLAVSPSLSLKTLRVLCAALTNAALGVAPEAVLVGRLDKELVLSFPKPPSSDAADPTKETRLVPRVPGPSPAGSFLGVALPSLPSFFSSSAPRTTVQSSEGRKEARAKRSRTDSALDLARNTVRRLAGGDEGEGAASLAAATSSAQRVVAALVALRTSDGAVPLESYAVSRRPAGSWGSVSAAEAGQKDSGTEKETEAAADTVLVAARMVQGVGLPLQDVCDALQSCEDGMLTIDESMLASGFRLPHSAPALHARTASMLIVGVPCRTLHSAF